MGNNGSKQSNKSLSPNGGAGNPGGGNNINMIGPAGQETSLYDEMMKLKATQNAILE